MFCDMVGSSNLSTRLDPEEQRDIVSAFQSCCANEITRLSGMVAQYLGDGVLAYFGYPAAHENDAERAVRAGLLILDALGTLNSAAKITLQARIGIASGVVVVGDLVRESVMQENAAIGETTNLAARLQSIAEPNTIVISPDTHRLIGALFRYRDLGHRQLKGFVETVHVRQVIGPSKIENRFEAQHGAGMSPLLGREEEVELLARRWTQAIRGQGRVVLIIGEPGIGKSRIAKALQDRLVGDLHTQLSYHCSPFHQNSELYPIIGQLTNAAGIEHADSMERKRAKLESLLAQSSKSLDADMALFTAMLSITRGEGLSTKLPPQQLKEQTLDALIAHLIQLSARRPVLLLFEDLHWVDPTSLELLTRVVELAHSLPLLLVGTARPEFLQPWPNYRHTTTLTLSRLDTTEGRMLVEAVAKGKALPDEVLDQIVGRSDGVPLFLEELTKTVIESGILRETADRYDLTGPLPPHAIPATLRASLLARLDRLAYVKDVVQIGAVIGREFSYRLIAAVSAVPDDDLQDALSRLVAAELISQRGSPPDATYLFKHALIQDAAYDSLIRNRRQLLHNKIADILEGQFAAIVLGSPQQLARHYAEACQWEKAAFYSLSAGQMFSRRAAFVEATFHLERGITATKELPDGPTRNSLERDLTVELAAALRSIRGYASPEVEDRYLRALELAQLTGDFEKKFNVEWGLMQCSLVKGNLGRADEFAKALWRHVGRHPSEPRADAHLAEGMVSFHLGRFEEARNSFEQGAALTDPARDGPHFFTHGQNPGVFCRSYLAWTLWFLGYPDSAKSVAGDTLELSRTRADDPAHVFSWVSALTFGCRVHQLRRDVGTVNRLAGELIAVAKRNRYAYYEALGTIQLAWAQAMENSVTIGLQRMEAGLSALGRTGTMLGQRGFWLQLAEVYVNHGRKEEALAALSKSTGQKELGTKCWDAEIERVRGEALALGPGADHRQSEAAFLCSLQIARSQKARSLELRSAVSYARLLQRLKREADAYDVLDSCLATFDEGRDTADLHGARKLLDALPAPIRKGQASRS